MFSGDSSKAVARNAIKVCGACFGGGTDGSPICYGQKVALFFSDALAVQGMLASCPSGRSGLSTQLVGKQEAYMQGLHESEGISYDCAWCAAARCAPSCRRRRSPPSPPSTP